MVESHKKSQKHLAIFTQPFLDLILSGKKTVESRFSQNRIAPFGQIQKGDIVIMKESGGLVLGEFKAGKAISFHDDLSEAKKYSQEICASVNPDFWEKRSKARYATLIEIVNPVRYKQPRQCHEKNLKDRRAWIVLGEIKN